METLWLPADKSSSCSFDELLFLGVLLLTAGARDYLTARLISSQDNFDDRVAISVPHSTFFYRLTDAGDELTGSVAVMEGDCRLDSSGNNLLLTCGITLIPILESE
jgi:hypothetical protein